MTSDYIYQVLPPHYMRLLLASVNGTEIAYQLVQVDSDQAPVYSALSYTWDGQKPTEDLFCSGKTLKVTSNVLIFLSHLADVTLDGDHHIWIDGICINQNEDLEKSIQVSMMRKIYAQANKVMVWLGQGSLVIDEGIDQIQSLTEKLNGFDGQFGFGPERLAAHQLPALESDVWFGIYDLLCQGWFTRVWVLQEAILAKETLFMCGRKTFTFKDVVAFVDKLLESDASPLVRRDQRGANMAILKGIRSLQVISLYKNWASVNRQHSFLSILLMGATLLATDPRDEIYGFLGLADDKARSCIKVDYKNKGTLDVYIEAARYLVETEADLEILQFASHDEEEEIRIPHLPSWCPNFIAIQRIPKLGYATGMHAGFKDLKLEAVLLPFRASLLENTNVLLVEGLHIDTVKDVQKSAWRWLDEPPEFEGISSALQSLSWIDGCLEMSKQVYDRPQDAIEAHSRTLVANTLTDKRCESDQSDMLRFIRDTLEFGAPEKENTKELINRLTFMTGSQIKDAEIYRCSMDSACLHRVFFSTNGCRIGLGTSSTRPDDLIYIIRNTRTPFILRPSEENTDHLQLIGEAYVHGLMYGEAFDLAAEDDFQTVRLD